MRFKIASLIVWLAAADAGAGTIGITISHRAELRDAELRADVTVTNTGDEAAYSVTPTLRFRGQEVRGETQATLPPQRPVEQTLAVAAGALQDGQWPYQVVVDYADANQYPFQALSVATLQIGSPPPPKVAIPKLSSPSLSDRGELEMRVKNLSAVERRVAVSVLGPEAIEVTQTGAEIQLEPWEEKDLSVRLTNRAALAGSRYPLFVAVEYEDGAVHHALVAQTTVAIGEPSEALGPQGRYLWIAAGVFGLLFAGLVAYRLAKR
jgi:hypothetical protein